MCGKLFKLLCCLPLVGCAAVLPELSQQPVVRNPFPQLSRVAVAPFFNHSDEPTVDGREFARAYFSELQATPGFEVVPLGVIEETMIAHRINLSGPGEARRLAELLGVDAVVVGTVTDYSPYYPPRCGLRVEWYTANSGYHEIPAGYGLPWNTPEEEFIPDRLVYESQFALAKAQLATQAPNCHGKCLPLPAPPTLAKPIENSGFEQDPFEKNHVRLLQNEEELPVGELADEMEPIAAGTQEGAQEDTGAGAIDTSIASPTSDATETSPSNWPDENCFVPANPRSPQQPCVINHGPVLRHTAIYHGHDPQVTQALKNYVYFRDDARFGGWESYLQRSDDFIRFCCHTHIWEMLSARGGSRKTRLVLRWPDSR